MKITDKLPKLRMRDLSVWWNVTRRSPLSVATSLWVFGGFDDDALTAKDFFPPLLKEFFSFFTNKNVEKTFSPSIDNDFKPNDSVLSPSQREAVAHYSDWRILIKNSNGPGLWIRIEDSSGDRKPFKQRDS